MVIASSSKSHHDAALDRLVDGEFVVAAPQVLDEGMPRDDCPSAHVGRPCP
jgi:hypothetical protein